MRKHIGIRLTSLCLVVSGLALATMVACGRTEESSAADAGPAKDLPDSARDATAEGHAPPPHHAGEGPCETDNYHGHGGLACFYDRCPYVCCDKGQTTTCYVAYEYECVGGPPEGPCDDSGSDATADAPDAGAEASADAVTD